MGELAVKIGYVLFDLDGTLLPMNQVAFEKVYFEKLTEKLLFLKHNPIATKKSIYKCVDKMISNDGEQTNEEVFWKSFEEEFNVSKKNIINVVEEFYKNEFQELQIFCNKDSEAIECIDLLQKNEYKVIIATNPVFPAIATESRIRWAGFSPQQLVLYTTYENFHYCKPNLSYYLEITEKLNCSPKECLMVGNNTYEDMIAEKLGMKTFLVTDCLINSNNIDISRYDNGSFKDFSGYIKKELLK